MRFEKLRLNGFKSFVDPTDLVIAEGLTGVVGPNGCGKSNLLEALRWVMGESRPSAMRGGGMEDVIFAGAASRPARAFAEVSITIDNRDRLAPAAFNDHDHLEIVRRITRDAGSAYRLQGKDVRARDVQMLFADASTGAQSPALVRQGQIAELINARPKNRRRILEEAAGISGLYQRRHEAELKLRAAEGNLSRVDDVIETLAGQLSQLVRQARQAARYREIGEALRRAEGVLLWRRWHEADLARLTAAAAATEAVTAASAADRQARAAEDRRSASEAALPPLREEEAIAAALVQRLGAETAALTDRARRADAAIVAIAGRLSQVAKDLDRERALGEDAALTAARLDAEEAELVAAGEGEDDALRAAEAAAEEAAKVLSARETDLSEVTERVARLAARHQSAERRREDARTTRDRSVRAAEAARDAAAEARRALETATATLARETEAAGKARTAAEAAESALDAADGARAELQSREAEARAAKSAADGEVAALRAEVAALDRLLGRDMAEGRQLMDLLGVAPGYEDAIGAALADDLRAPLLDRAGGTGWSRLAALDAPPPLPAGAEPLATRVTAPDVLDRRLALTGVVPASEGDRLQAALSPGQRLVSPEGDLWRWDGYRSAAADAPSAAALRLRQINRLEELKQHLARATASAEGTARAHARLARDLAAAQDADAAARRDRRAADAALTEATRAESRAEAARNIAAGRVESADLAERRHREEAVEGQAALASAEAALADLPDLAGGKAEAEDLRLTVDAARITMMARRTAASDAVRAATDRKTRLKAVRAERESWARRAETTGQRLADLEARRAALAAEHASAEAQPARIAAEIARHDTAARGAEARRTAAVDRLSAAEAEYRQARDAATAAERVASEAREARARAGALVEAATEAADGLARRIAEEREATPETLLAALGAPAEDLPDAEAADAEVQRLRRSRDALGAVNLRAEEDAEAVRTEHDLLVTEKADLEEAIGALRSGIQGLNREGRDRLLTAFEQVNGNFATLFTHLFGGGEARLELVESDDPLDAGLEILCQPPGKKLSTLSLLSGGEQTLTALALIFAVFLANPAPICVLDEVDAPLDDANVTRFCDMLDEMTRRTETRFLVITHHAVTMARMDRLFGVTMGEPGVSQLVSVDLRRAEAMVA